MFDTHSRRSGLTLVEVLVLIALFGVGLSLLMPAVAAAQKRSAAQQTMDNLKTLALATHNCHGTYTHFPPAYGKYGIADGPVYFHLLPFVEQDDIYRAINDKGSPIEGTVEVYVTPEDPSLDKKKSTTSFAANLRLFTRRGFDTGYNKNMEPFKKKEDCTLGKLRLKEITDGTSNTLMFTTKYAVCGEGGSKWPSSPVDKTAPFFGLNAATEKASATSAKGTFQLAPSAKECLCTPPMAQSFTKKGLAAALVDGSVRTINAGISAETWNRAVQPNDGKELGKDWAE